MNRRSFVMTTGKSAAITAIATSLATRLTAADAAAPASRIKHSVCKWCYGSIPLEDLCVAGKEMGLQSIELLMPGDFPTLRKHGLTCAMVGSPGATTAAGVRVGGITHAFNRVEHHDAQVTVQEPPPKDTADPRGHTVHCLPRQRPGMDDQQGLENCVTGLKRLLPAAEKHGVKIVMELLNSKVDHGDYMCDHSAWGVELCKRLDSPHFGLLYDIYHMQIMEGDVIRTIRDHHRWFAHYHTGGVPGRNEIDESQELHYPAIMRAIADTGYTGHVGQEFIPKRPDKLASLRQALGLCSV